MSQPVPTVALNNGAEMPLLGLGVFQIPADRTQAAVEAAIAAGYRHVDTAASYFNEEAVGAAVRACDVPREQLWVTTKLWIQRDEGGGVGEATKRAFDRSLARLGLDYVDLYLIHQPVGDYYAEWRAMQDLYCEGRVRAIGVCNFFPDRLVDLIDHVDVPPAVDQIEAHPFYQRLADQRLMVERGVQPESWGPFAQGRNGLFGNPVLASVAAAHGRSVAQVVLRWLTQRGVAAVPKSGRPDRMAENLDVFDFELADEEMQAIATLDTGASLYFDHRDPAQVARLGARRIAV